VAGKKTPDRSRIAHVPESEAAFNDVHRGFQGDVLENQPFAYLIGGGNAQHDEKIEFFTCCRQWRPP
jgi:hypothetical protein